MKRIEKDPEGGWIARRRDGSLITDEHWRWNSRSAARSAVAEIDMLEARKQAPRLDAKAASAMIAKIPPPLSRHIAAIFRP